MLIIFLSFFSSWKGLLLHFCIYSSVCCCLILQETSFTLVQNICIHRVIDPWNLPLYQVDLTFCCLMVFCFILSPSWVYFRNMWSWTIKEKMFVPWKVKLFCISSFFYPRCVQPKVVNEQSLMKYPNLH